LHDLSSTGSHFLVVSFITRLKSTLCTALNTQNTTEDCYFILHVPRTLHFSEIELLTPESLTVLRNASILCVTTRITRKNRAYSIQTFRTILVIGPRILACIFIRNQQMNQNDHIIVMSSQTLLHVSEYQRHYQAARMTLTTYVYVGVYYRMIL
jgi:hypothetical protein